MSWQMEGMRRTRLLQSAVNLEVEGVNLAGDFQSF